jgi:hypothetical protein
MVPVTSKLQRGGSMRSFHHRLGGIAIYAVLIVCLPRSVWCQAAHPASAGSCHATDYRILSPTILAIRCSEKDVSALVDLSASVYSLEITAITDFSAVSSVTPVKGDREWLSLVLLKPLVPNKKYRLVLNPKHPDGVQPSPFSYDFDTNEVISLAQSNVTSHPNQYELSSKLGFRGDEPAKAQDCVFKFRDYSGRAAKSSKVRCTYLNNISPAMTGDIAATLARQRGLEGVGIVTLDFSHSSLGDSHLYQLPVGIEGLTDIFGNPLKLDPKSKFTPQKAPANKDASSYYANVNYAAGVGSKPAWILDGKLAPPMPSLVGGFQLSPLVTADIGRNTISGMTYTDTIDIGGSAARVIPLKSALREILLTPGVTYETDREFDRENLLATIDARFNFAHLYNPQSTRSLQKFRSELKDMQASAKTSGDSGANQIVLQPEDIKPPLLGYALDFHLGMEAGGALVNTTVKATSGSATEVLPSYNIVRIVPQVHGLLQIRKFSVDSTAVIRYLAATENTVVQLPNKTLELEKLSGWKAYWSVNGTWNLDESGHLGVTIVYKDGFCPPKFQRVNTVQGGLTFKY